MSRPAIELIYTTHIEELGRLAFASAVDSAGDVDRATQLIATALHRGHKILVCGNGGSFSDAGHFSAEFVGRYMSDRPAWSALDLSSGPAITAIANDYGFEFIYSRQIEALGNPSDVLVVISTSGMSPNLIEAVKAAREHGLKVITLTGKTAHSSLVNADVWCSVDSTHTAHIQEIQIAMLHAICEGVENLL